METRSMTPTSARVLLAPASAVLADRPAAPARPRLAGSDLCGPGLLRALPALGLAALLGLVAACRLPLPGVGAQAARPPAPAAAIPGAPSGEAPGGVTFTRDVVYGHKDGMALFYDVLKPEKPNGAAVAFMVSGGWFSRWVPAETRARGFRGLLEHGFTVFAVHHGSAPRFKVPDAVADVRRAIRHIRMNAAAYGIDPQRIGVTGGSAGGHLSLMLGLASDAGEAGAEDPVLRVSDRVQAVVALYPPVDLRRMTGPNRRFPALDFPQEEAAAISPLLFVSPDDPPTLLIHGDADQLVSLSNSTSLLAALQPAQVASELIVVEGGAHGFPNPEHRRRSDAAMVDWFEKYLNAGNAPRKATPVGG
jgi:acetyl esterase/lipase